MPKTVPKKSSFNPLAFSGGLADAHQETVTEDIRFNKAIQERQEEGLGKELTKWVTAALIFATTGNVKAAKYGGEGAKYLADLFMGSENVDLSTGGKYGFSQQKERQEALDRYDKESALGDIIGTGTMFAGDLFKSDTFKLFEEGKLDFLDMVGKIKDDITGGVESLILPNVSKPWSYGGGK